MPFTLADGHVLQHLNGLSTEEQHLMHTSHGCRCNQDVEDLLQKEVAVVYGYHIEVDG